MADVSACQIRTSTPDASPRGAVNDSTPHAIPARTTPTTPFRLWRAEGPDHEDATIATVWPSRSWPGPDPASHSALACDDVRHLLHVARTAGPAQPPARTPPGNAASIPPNQASTVSASPRCPVAPKHPHPSADPAHRVHCGCHPCFRRPRYRARECIGGHHVRRRRRPPNRGRSRPTATSASTASTSQLRLVDQRPSPPHRHRQPTQPLTEPTAGLACCPRPFSGTPRPHLTAPK